MSKRRIVTWALASVALLVGAPLAAVRAVEVTAIASTPPALPTDHLIARTSVGVERFDVSGADRSTVLAASWVMSASASNDGSRVAVWGLPPGGTQDVFTANIDGSGLTNVTNDADSDSFPSFSPDGDRLLFSSYRSSDENVYEADLDGGNEVQRTTLFGSDTEAKLSNDGTKIVFRAFESDNNGGIWTMNANGTSPTRRTAISTFDAHPDWSPDGSKIAFASSPGVGTPFQIWTMNADGTGLTQRTSIPAGADMPAWSPDGNWIAFATGGDIWLMRPDGTDHHRVTSTADTEQYPDWVDVPDPVALPTDDLISRTDAGVERFDVNGADRSTILPDPWVMSANPSSDGTKIAVWGVPSGGTQDVFTANIDGTGLTNVTNDADADSFPSFAPDGSRLLYSSYRSFNDNVYEADLDGGNEVLRSGLANSSEAEFSPDGTKIVLRTFESDGNGGIWTMNADGTSPTRRTAISTFDAHPDWSPDGTKIAFASSPGYPTPFQVWTMNADGTGLTQTTNIAGGADMPAWSPDGNWIAYSTGGDIWLMRPDGTNHHRVTSTATTEWYPEWVPPATPTPPTPSPCAVWHARPTGTDAALHSLSAIDATTVRTGAYVLNTELNAYEGRVFSTTNAGEDWTELAKPVNQPFGLHFADADNGWSTGTGVINRTSNGGTSWVQQPLPGGTSGFWTYTGVDSVNGTTAWISASAGTGSGRIIATTNGGSSWTEQVALAAAVEAVDVVNASVVWAAGAYGTVLRTVNGGASWSTFETGATNHFRSIAALDANRAVAVGFGGLIYGTVDGGATWTNRSITAGTLLDVDIVPSGHGWAVGVESLLETTDGGLTWTRQPTPEAEDLLRSVDMVDAGHAFISGEHGMVLACGAAIVTNSADDTDDGACTSDHCSLREAIDDANADPDLDAIRFNLPAPHTITVTAPLPHVTAPLTIDGSSQPGYTGTPVVTIDGDLAGDTHGLVVKPGGSGSTVKAMRIKRFVRSGVRLEGNGSVVERNEFTENRGAGVSVTATATGNTITANSIHGNGGTGIDHDPAGASRNECAIVTGVQAASGGTIITGQIDAAATSTYRVELFTDEGHPDGTGASRSLIHSFTSPITNGSGFATFSVFVATTIADDLMVTATITDAAGTTYEECRGYPAGPGDVGVEKFVSADRIAEGDDLTYTIVVTNHGPAAKNMVEVTDDLAAGLTFAGATIVYQAQSGTDWIDTTEDVPKNPECVSASDPPAPGDVVTCHLYKLHAPKPVGDQLGLWRAVITMTVETSTDLVCVQNQATVDAVGFDPDSSNNTSGNPSSCVAADVVVAKSGPATANRGSQITYRITATNNGPAASGPFTVTDTVPDHLTFDSAAPSNECALASGVVTCTSSGLAANATATWDLTFTIDPATPCGTTVSNTAALGDAPRDDVDTNDSATAGTEVGCVPGTIKITKQTDPDGSTEVFNFTGSITATLGDGDSDSVSVAPGTYYAYEAAVDGWDVSAISCSDSDSSGNTSTGAVEFVVTDGETVECTITNRVRRGKIVVDKVTDPAGSSKSFDFTAQGPGLVAQQFSLTDAAEPNEIVVLPGEGYSVAESAAVGWSSTVDCGTESAADIDISPGETVTCVFTNTALPDLSILKSAPSQAVVAGTPAPFSIVVTNDGLGAAGAYSVTDTVPTGTSFNGTASSPACTESAGVVTCAGTGLAAGSSETFTIALDVDTEYACNTSLSNTATLTSDAADYDNTNHTSTATVSSVSCEADLSVAKLAVGGATAGGTATFSVAVTNGGPSASGSFTVTDSVPSGLTFVAGGSSSACAATAGVVTCSSSGLDNGATVTWTLVFAVATDVCGAVTNTATFGSRSATDDDSSDDSSSASITVTCPNVPGRITLTKQTDPDGSTQKFQFSGALAGMLADGESLTAEVAAGSYTVTEAQRAGWTVQSIVCNDDDSSGDTSTRTATFVVGGGDHVTCVVTNRQQRATILVDKVTQPANAPDDFDFAIRSGGNVVASFTTDAPAAPVATEVLPGRYSVTETVATGWNLLASTCSNGDPVTAIDVRGGDVVTCTFTNRSEADVRMTKTAPARVRPNDAGAMVFTSTITVTNDGPGVASNVRISDDLPANAVFVSVTSGASVSCNGGDPVVCTVAQLASGNSVVIDVVARGTTYCSAVVNTASVTTSSFDPNSANNSATSTSRMATVEGNGLDNILDGDGGNDVICAYGGADMVRGRGGNDVLLGGDGLDTLDYGWVSVARGGAISGATVNLTSGTATSAHGAETLASFDNVWGSQFHDHITGHAGSNSLYGQPGNDTIFGGAGPDTIWGAEGSDFLSGGEGNDEILGGDHADEVYGGDDVDTLHGGSGGDEIHGGPHADTIQGNAGNDSIFGEDGNDVINAGDDDDTVNAGLGRDTVFGEAGKDKIFGDARNTSQSDNWNCTEVTVGDSDIQLAGGDGNDLICGQGGADTMNGNAGVDVLYGGPGNDTMHGGDGANSLFGGAGTDTCSFGPPGETRNSCERSP